MQREIADQLTICAGCGLALTVPDTEPALNRRYNCSTGCWQLFSDLSFYTLSLADEAFVHQLAVDTYGAQHSGESTKPITTAFALIGLYLAFEKGYTGKQVQMAHVVLANRSKKWPRFQTPDQSGTLTIQYVVQHEDDSQRLTRLSNWAMSVWQTWHASHPMIRQLTHQFLF